MGEIRPRSFDYLKGIASPRREGECSIIRRLDGVDAKLLIIGSEMVQDMKLKADSEITDPTIPQSPPSRLIVLRQKPENTP